MLGGYHLLIKPLIRFAILPDKILRSVESEARSTADQVEDHDDGESEDGVSGDFRGVTSISTLVALMYTTSN